MFKIFIKDLLNASIVITTHTIIHTIVILIIAIILLLIIIHSFIFIIF